MTTMTGCLLSLLVFITVFELYSAQQRFQCPRDFRMKRNYECRQASGRGPYRSDIGRYRDDDHNHRSSRQGSGHFREERRPYPTAHAFSPQGGRFPSNNRGSGHHHSEEDRGGRGGGRRGGRLDEYRYFIEDCCYHDHGNGHGNEHPRPGGGRPSGGSFIPGGGFNLGGLIGSLVGGGTQIPRECRQRRDEGYRCRSQRSVQHYYYDYNSGRCRRFTHQGCGGNSNNYHSYSECQRTCSGRFA